MIASGELLIRLVVGTTLGGIIGYERDVHGRPAGFRRTGASIQGLTTAAGLWLVAAIGLASGAGMYVVSAAATLVGVVALAVLRRFEHKDDQLPAHPCAGGSRGRAGRVRAARRRASHSPDAPGTGTSRRPGASGRPARVAARPRARADRADRMTAERRGRKGRPGQ
ncbi:MAG: hypothetical protein DMD87_05765 [Candidatus Rokuibacteriota bacterium]|nr:MAG: hypothetical protein DMD87_05765 [Candidatus Rokubacteria bacterium]